MTYYRNLLGTVLAAGLLAGWTAQAALTPASLRCEQRANPLGIGEAAPRLSWQLQSDGVARGEIQSAYQIQVGTTAGTADLWDSGKVASPNTVDIRYAGTPLASGQPCFWRVRAYDGSGNASAWSAPAQWSMGLLSTNDWSAQWIGYDAAYNLTPTQATNAALFNTSGQSWMRYPAGSAQNGGQQMVLRKQIVLPAGQTVTNAVFALYADNSCGVIVNGQANTNLVVRWEATTQINVTSALRAGTNVLALCVTNSDAQERAAVIGRLVVQFASGSVSNFPVDTSWKAGQNPPAGWTQAGFDDSSWPAAESLGSPWGTPSLNDITRMPVPYLRKDWVADKTVRRATLYATALGIYEFRLNGQKVGDAVMTPGWTEFSKRVHYQTYDVTGMIQPGTNTLGAILGDGWYASVLAFTGKRNNYGGAPRLLGQLVLEFTDGSKQTIVTDGSWKASYGPISFGDLLLGSSYDARKEMPGWDAPGFDDRAWSSVATGQSHLVVGYRDVTAIIQGLVSNNRLNFVASNSLMGGDPAFGVVKTLQITYNLGGTVQTQSFTENTAVSIGQSGQTLTILQAYYGDARQFPGSAGVLVQAAVTEPSRCLEERPALKLTQPKPGCYTFDLGQNMAGWVRLKIAGQPGDRITVRHGEMLNPDGSVYTANLRGANATDFYIFATNGTVTYEPRFTFHGFRYVEIRGLSRVPTLNSVTGIVVYSDMPHSGNFACSSPLLNQLFHNINWGQMGNYLEVPTDCPQRDERLGWTGDAQFFVPTAARNFDVQTFFRRWLVTLCEDAQYPDGSFAHVAPNLGAGTGSTAWGDAAWICTYEMYRTYGDTNIIADHYAAFQRYEQYLANHASNYVIASLTSDYGDWVNLGGGATGSVIDTAYYAYFAQAMSEMAAAIGKTADAAHYAALHRNIVAAYANFFNADGSFKDGSSQTGYALAFTLGLVPDSLRDKAAQQFANSIAKFGNHLATGFIGTPRLLPALNLAGRTDLAYLLLLQETYPSWLFQVNLGATTMWERWDGWTPDRGFQTVGMNSFNHYAFGAVGEFLYGTVGGINPSSPGFKTIDIHPVPGAGLTWVNTSYNSVRGLITTAWTNSNSRFDLAVTIPANTTARVFVPTTNAAAITEGGVPTAQAPGVSFIAVSNGCAIYSVGSGQYFWSSPYSPPPGSTIKATTTNQMGASSTVPFTPDWQLNTNDDLIFNHAPQSYSGNFNQEPYLGNRSVNMLTRDHNFTITTGGSTYTTCTNYVTCGNGSGAGAMVTYALAGSASGYDLTNITVYGGWGDNGRDQQSYTVYYSTVMAPTNFVNLAQVSYNPDVPDNTPSATRVSLTSAGGVLAANVAAVKFDFTSPGCENGYCGYARICVYGSASSTRVLAAILNAAVLADSARVVLAGSGLIPGLSYLLQSATNLVTGEWQTETSFTAAQSTWSWTNDLTGAPQKFYRILKP